ncbi:hypothetical protein MNBD_GAMMA13-872 [hydrothermal vent metagenome]|uniref:Uncharacterized protein n=1 Tax=hydrothermal vent metagenome TaxID=652676 RepID=A0A3B0XTL9_9ZZZZ
MNTTMHQSWRMEHVEWLELAVFLSVAVMAIVLLIASYRLFQSRCHRPETAPVSTMAWQRIPEIQLLVLGLPLHLLWEIAQFPLYTVWHEGTWSYILYGLAHCTLGDLLILLVAYEIVAMLAGSRYWPQRPKPVYVLVFTLLGMAYTVWSETINVRIKGTWGYTDLMPIIPGIEIGAMPFLQWLLISPLLVWFMRLLFAASSQR